MQKKFGKQIKKIAELTASPINFTSAEKLKEMEKLGDEVMKGINSMGDFAYLSMLPIAYPDDKVIHFSINIVDKKDKHRLSYFLPKPKEDINDSGHLIEKWLEYEQAAQALTYKKNERFLDFKSCPVHHCVYGFEHEDLKKYEGIFNDGAAKYKRNLIAILRQDKNEEKRATAALLLAHLKDDKEVIKALSSSIFDSDSGVRNNAMRVMGATLIKNNSANFPIKNILTALDFPEETDRNKAMMIMIALVKHPVHADYVKKHASLLLIDNLKSSQPNLHNSAYVILKAISGKNFADHDYKSWEEWAKSVQK